MWLFFSSVLPGVAPMSSLGPKLDGRDSSDGEFNQSIWSAGFNDPSALTASPSGFDGSFIGKSVLRVSSGSICRILQLDFEINSLRFFFLVGGASSSNDVAFFFPVELDDTEVSLCKKK